MAFFVLGSLSLITLAGAACARGGRRCASSWSTSRPWCLVPQPRSRDESLPKRFRDVDGAQYVRLVALAASEAAHTASKKLMHTESKTEPD